jgi:alkyl sulfatase BDS1-like metallo-beta-lactamase superfamily hydrolase
MKNGPVSNINDLTRWPDAIEQPRLLALIGGRKRAMLEANKALRAGDPRWAGALANMVLQQHPGDVAARKLQKAALLRIAYTTMSANERNYALTDVLDLPWQTLLVTTMEAKIRHISTLNVLNQWSVRLHHADALTTRLELRVVVDDEPYLLTLREGVLDVVPATGVPGAASLAMTRSALDRIGAGALTLKDAIDTGLVSPSGDAAIARRLADLMM